VIAALCFKKDIRILQKSTKAIFVVIAKLLIVFAGSVGVFGMFLDYLWFTEPDTITNEKVILKYFAGLLAVISHGISMLRRNRPADTDVSSNLTENNLE